MPFCGHINNHDSRAIKDIKDIIVLWLLLYTLCVLHGGADYFLKKELTKICWRPLKGKWKDVQLQRK
jgi:hypothetical protein